MKAPLCLTLGAVAFSSAAFAQTQSSFDAAPEPIFAGTYSVATGTFTRAGTATTEGVSAAIYENSALVGTFYDISDGSTVLDEGRIPSTTSTGAQNTYTVDNIAVAYCTRRADVMSGGVGATVELGIYERKGSGLCSNPVDFNNPLASFTIPGLPGSTADGTLGCFIVDIDLTGVEFCVHADGNGEFDGDVSDLFAWSFRMPNEDPLLGTAGPLIAGDPLMDPGGTGLDTQDAFIRINPDDSVQCLFFGGFPANSFASFFLRVDSPVDGECVGCGVADDRFDPNDTCADAVQLARGITPNLYIEQGDNINEDEDYFLVDVPAGEALRIDLTFGPASDLDLLLYDDDTCANLLATGFSITPNETIRWPNCTANDVTWAVRVNHFAGPCTQYDLSLSLDALGRDDDFLEENDDCASAVPLPLGLTEGLIVRPDCGTGGGEDSDFYSITIEDGMTIDAEILFEDIQADLDLILYSDNTCTNSVATGFTTSDNESISWTNTTGAAVDATLEVDHFLGASNEYSMRVCLSEAVELGSELCAGVANSTGVGADLQAQGSAAALDNDVELVVRNLPQFSSGFFVTSQDNIVVMNPGGSVGNICIASLSIGRYDTFVQNSGESGVVCLGIDLTATPVQPGGPIAVMPGETWNFQYWYRDTDMGNAVSNFSSATSVVFN